METTQCVCVCVCVCGCVCVSDGGSQDWLVGPDVGGPAAPAGRSLPARRGRPGGERGRHGAQHAAAETQRKHLVS